MSEPDSLVLHAPGPAGPASRGGGGGRPDRGGRWGGEGSTSLTPRLLGYFIVLILLQTLQVRRRRTAGRLVKGRGRQGMGGAPSMHSSSIAALQPCSISPGFTQNDGRTY